MDANFEFRFFAAAYKRSSNTFELKIREETEKKRGGMKQTTNASVTDRENDQRIFEESHLSCKTRDEKFSLFSRLTIHFTRHLALLLPSTLRIGQLSFLTFAPKLNYSFVIRAPRPLYPLQNGAIILRPN